MNWADKQIKKDHDEKESTKISEELRVWDHRLKDEVGKGCFDAVREYVKTETEKYNKAQTTQASGIFFLPDSSVEEEGDIMSRIPSFTIFRKDQPRARLYVKYSQPRHALLWKCGSSDGFYDVRVHENGTCFFVGSDGNPKTPDQIGNELLDQANRAEPTGGRIWA